MNDDDVDGLMEEWISTGFRRGVMVGVACGAMSVAVVAVIGWLL
jgi:hypothetical protein